MEPGNRARGRPRKFGMDAAREAAMMTFWRNGYRATTLDDLVAATGASRASLYKDFGDKQTIFADALDLYATRFDARVEAALASGASAKELIETVLTASAKRLTGGDAPPGCLRCNSTLEMAGHDPEMDVLLQSANARFEAAMSKLTHRAAEEKLFPAKRAAPIAKFLTAVVGGLVVMARSGADLEALQTVVESTVNSLEAA